MQLLKEDNLLEQSLRLADESYGSAYRFLQDAYAQSPADCGPQTFYFLACFAGGSRKADDALQWLTESIERHGFWYRPEVLADDDLACIMGEPAFLHLCKISGARYADAVANAVSVCSWTEKRASKLLLAVHGNTQNAAMARAAWEPLASRTPDWQLETVQSATPDGYGTFRWVYDDCNYLDFASAAEKAGEAGYARTAWTGFSAGCDMLLRTLVYTPLRCDCLLLQSPWLPLLETDGAAVARTIAQKGASLHIFCGENDADCLPPAQALYADVLRTASDAHLTRQKGLLHQFPDVLGEEYSVLP